MPVHAQEHSAVDQRESEERVLNLDEGEVFHRPLNGAVGPAARDLFPLDRRRRFRTDVIDHAVDAADLVGDARRDP